MAEGKRSAAPPFAAGNVPLERALSKLGVCSRTEASRWIAAGRVSVDGAICRDTARPVVPERVAIAIDGRPWARAEKVLIALHKPRGVVTTRSDPRGAPTVYDLLAELPSWVVPVGRLDQATSGLLLLTNDTQLANALTDPVSGVERAYVATVRGRASDDLPGRLCAGLVEGGELLRASAAEVSKASGRESRLHLILQQGRNREVRRLCQAAGHPVTRLLRVRYGPFELGALTPGQWRIEPIAEAWAFLRRTAAGRERDGWRAAVQSDKSEGR